MGESGAGCVEAAAEGSGEIWSPGQWASKEIFYILKLGNFQFMMKVSEEASAGKLES